ncbi:MAG: peroxiredoxin [Deltaproteobacteria bacterium]|nr:peroxiredoxin [Deltaproteobacteria bacterium]
MLTVASHAPEIDAVDNHGRRFRLSEQWSRLCTIVFFYPRAFTPGCTRETAAFRDSHSDLAQLGASVVGISTDDGPTQCRFADFMKAPFPMIGDPQGEITRAYGVRWPLLKLAKRVTFVIGPSQIVLGTFHRELAIQQHHDEVVTFVKELAKLRTTTPGA